MREKQQKHKSYKNRRKNEKEVYITLPYDFIPFPDEYEYPYSDINEIPKHDDEGYLSGMITYKITPYSDLAIEVRKDLDGNYFTSGSTVRGKIRSNLEILSASYPEFINRTTMLYRNVSDRKYRMKVKSDDDQNTFKDNGIPRQSVGAEQDIERSIRVGFLRKDESGFYVTPAKKIGDKFFLTIKEHRLMNMKLGNNQVGKIFTIYQWYDAQENIVEKLNKIQLKIDRLTDSIKEKRAKFKEKVDEIQKNVSTLFTENYSFKSALGGIRKKLKQETYNYDNELNQKYNDLVKELQEIEPDSKLHNLFQLTADRWKLKAQMHLEYSKLKSNANFIPYQSAAYFKRTSNNGIEYISFNPAEEITEKCYLYNSTNASSKRNHYVVMEPNEEQKNEYLVPQSVINAYQQNLKKIRFTEKGNRNKIMDFYDLFESFDKLVQGNKSGLIVFYKTCKNSATQKVEIEGIGRTPYFKLSYNVQLSELIGEKEVGKLDYAQALFGFTSEKESIAFKSRLRLSPVDITVSENEPFKEINNLVLLSPFASANAMYIQQKNNSKLITYEDNKENITLNGYKYYHILKQEVPTDDKIKGGNRKENESVVSCKKLLKAKGSSLSGKIYFHNLTGDELGLLLLSLDWKELRKSKKYSELISEFKDQLPNAFETLGGAKPYGYGKVKFEIQKLEIEKNVLESESIEIDDWLCFEEVNNIQNYIDEYITKMGGNDYARKVHFQHYIQSKMEREFPNKNNGLTIDTPMHVNWANISNKIKGGYPKNWSLITSVHRNKT